VPFSSLCKGVAPFRGGEGGIAICIASSIAIAIFTPHKQKKQRR
jgi:hypothetical protein